MIEQLTKKLAKHDRNGALALLLEAWAKTPSIAIADAIDALTALGTTDEHGTELRAIPGQTMAETIKSLRRARKWQDPRLTHVFTELLRKLPWAGAKSRDTWREIFDVLATHADARFIELAKALPATWKVGKPMQVWLGNQLAGALEHMPVAATHREDAAIAALASQLKTQVPAPAATPRNTESLLAAIYANPTDDTPRAIYADWLQERDDPRGEFIALQLANGKTKREAELLKQHGKAWLGPLANVFRGEFRRGFPAIGTATFRNQRDVEQFGNLTEWATIEELDYSNTVVRNDQKLWSRYLGPAQRFVRAAKFPAIEHLLAAKTPWAIEHLELDSGKLDTIDHEPIDRLLAGGLVPRLTHLGLMGWGAHPTWIEKTTQLPETFAISASLEDNEVGAWLANVASSPRCTAFVLRQYAGLLHTFRRNDRGAFTRLHTAMTPPTKAKTLEDASSTLGVYRESLAALKKRVKLETTATIVIAGKTVAI